MHFVDASGADTVLPFNSGIKSWEELIEIAGYNPTNYNDFETFITSDDYDTAITISEVVDSIYSNEMMFVYLLMYPDKVVTLLNDTYALKQIKTYENLCKLLIRKQDVVQKLYSSCTNKKSKSTTGSQISIDGLVLYVEAGAGVQFWGYNDRTGSAWANTYAYLNNTHVVTASTDTGTPSDGNYLSSGNSNGVYNYKQYSVNNTAYCTTNSGVSEGKEKHSGSMVVYYI